MINQINYFCFYMETRILKLEHRSFHNYILKNK